MTARATTTMASPPPSLRTSLRALLIPAAALLCAVQTTEAFSAIRPTTAAAATTTTATATRRPMPSLSSHGRRRRIVFSHRAAASDDDDVDDAVIETTEQEETATTKKKKKGDSLRDATGIRPSLHPVTINCVAEALSLRSRRVLGKTKTKEGIDLPLIDTLDPDAEPLQIAIAAAGIAMAAIDGRKAASETDETTDAFDNEESQTLSGRVVGVVVRLRDLEGTLVGKVNGGGGVGKYGEEGSFGVLKEECGGEGAADEEEGAAEKRLAEAIESDPLLRMNRAECLLALFLDTVERPQLEMLGQEVAGGSAVNFIDADRLEVLT